MGIDPIVRTDTHNGPSDHHWQHGGTAIITRIVVERRSDVPAIRKTLAIPHHGKGSVLISYFITLAVVVVIIVAVSNGHVPHLLHQRGRFDSESERWS